MRTSGLDKVVSAVATHGYDERSYPCLLGAQNGIYDKLIDEAVAKGYVELRPVPKKPAEEVLKNIEKIAEASTGNV